MPVLEPDVVGEAGDVFFYVLRGGIGAETECMSKSGECATSRWWCEGIA